MTVENGFRNISIISSSSQLLRSQALLSKAQFEMFKASGREVAFDPLQQGWVPLNCIDDIDESALQDFMTADDSVVRLGMPQESRASVREPLITFRRWRTQDLAQYKALLDDPHLWALLPEPYPDPFTDDLAASLIELSNETKHHDVRAVLADGVPVGQVRIVFAPADSVRESAEVSYWLGRDHWGCGIGARMVAAYVEEVTARFPSITMLIARIHRDNAASARIALKAGFHKTNVDDQDLNIEVYGIQLNR